MEGPATRRSPKQDRSKKKVSLILDTAENLLIEVGYDALTTNAIAERADISIGSLYQFFSNKEVLVEAVADRSQIALNNVLDEVLTAEKIAVPLPHLVNQLVEALVDFSLVERAFVVLFCGGNTPAPVHVVAHPLHEALLDRVKTVLLQRKPGIDDEALEVYATITVQILRALLPYLHVDGARNEVMITEVKRLLMDYLTPAVG